MCTYKCREKCPESKTLLVLLSPQTLGSPQSLLLGSVVFASFDDHIHLPQENCSSMLHAEFISIWPFISICFQCIMITVMESWYIIQPSSIVFLILYPSSLSLLFPLKMIFLLSTHLPSNSLTVSVSYTYACAYIF